MTTNTFFTPYELPFAQFSTIGGIYKSNIFLPRTSNIDSQLYFAENENRIL